MTQTTSGISFIGPSNNSNNSNNIGPDKIGPDKIGSDNTGHPNNISVNNIDSQATVQKLLEHPDLWQAGQLAESEPTHSSGFAELDANLPGQGWPQAGLAEFLLNGSGLGELQLLVPLLKQLSQEQERWIAWVNPPHVPYAPAMVQHGIALDKILMIHPKKRATENAKRSLSDPHKDALWALECAAKSGTCSVVLAWLDERRLTLKDTRRLQLAAKTGNTFVCLFRPESACQQASMAQLRIRLRAGKRNDISAGKRNDMSASEHNNKNANEQNNTDIGIQVGSQVTVSIEKRRRGWPLESVPLNFEHRPYQVRKQQAHINEQLSLWQRLQAKQLATVGKTVLDESGAQASTHHAKPKQDSQLTIVH